jgi:hypothetical protein
MSTERKPFPVRLDDADLRKLDDIRRREHDIPTRSEMLRRLIHRGQPLTVEMADPDLVLLVDAGRKRRGR